MDSPRLTYQPQTDATPEREVEALGSVYRFILDCHAKKEAAPKSRPGAAMKGFKNDRDTTSIPKT